jgi:predicted RNA-binding protein with RPS1 domain
MYQREAMWIQFNGSFSDYPKAIKVAVGKVNAVSGATWNQTIDTNRDAKQDYVVVPDQPWLDGIASGDGFVQQFVAMPLGLGYTVEHQVTGKEEFGGIQICIYNANEAKRKEHFEEKERQRLEQERIENERLEKQRQERMRVESENRRREQYSMVHSTSSIGGGGMVQPQMFFGAQQPMPTSAPLSRMSTSGPPPPPSAPQYNAPMAPTSNTGIVPRNDALFDAPVMEKSLMKKSKESKSESMSHARKRSAPVQEEARQMPVMQESEQQSFFVDEDIADVMDSGDRQVNTQQARELGIAAGGRMKQQITKDPYGAEFWDQENTSRIFVHIVNSTMFQQITGRRPPETPISAQTYTQHRYPWYDMYNEDGVAPTGAFNNIKSVRDIDQERYPAPQQNDNTVPINGNQVHVIKKQSQYDHLLEVLHEMGLFEDDKNIMLLERYKGNVDQVINAYFG